eukprot:scaffold1911_cov266-Chaetoceros_neogracile.AAC.5
MRIINVQNPTMRLRTSRVNRVRTSRVNRVRNPNTIDISISTVPQRLSSITFKGTLTNGVPTLSTSKSLEEVSS